MATATKAKVYLGTGRRKTSVARVRICDGTGKLTINKRPLDAYFTEHKDRAAVMAPLDCVEMAGKLDIQVLVNGGGSTGQSGAICQGLARALKTMYSPAADVAPPADGEAPTIPAQVKKLRDSGLLTRDARMKERKKYGRRGARRSFQFSKR